MQMADDDDPTQNQRQSRARMWRCGEAYQYPIPKPDGNPWEVVLEALLKKDKLQCAAWKDEVQNLLIFAGLFSAVVTSFAVQSYQSLQPGSNDLAVLLLARIATELQNATNVNMDSTIPSTASLLTLSSASASNLRINAFWFLSLVLSLTTVLIGIVSLQWLREHQHYSDSLSPRLALGIFHMRAQALERWYVPQVFAALPLLLQAALVLFFAGLIEFLIQLAPLVAIPVAIAVGLTVAFLLVTTVLPSLQCFSASLRQPLSNSPVPSPCPYKSPQSLAFRRLITLSRPIFSAIHKFIVYFLYFFSIKLPEVLFRLSRRRTKSAHDTWKHRLFSHRAYLFWASPHWIEFDRTWLILRNEHFDITRTRADSTKPSQSPLVDPIYDSMRALGMAIQGNEHVETVIFAAYHCFQDVSLSAQEEGEYPNDHLQACYRDLVPTWNSPIANIASIVVSPSVALLHDIHTVLFLRLPGIFYKAINPSHIFGKHMLELHTRILGDLFAMAPRALSELTQSGSTGFFHWYTINMSPLDFDLDMQDAFYEQFFMIFDSFIRTLISINDTRDLLNTFHTHADLDDFISLVAYLTWRTTQKSLARNNANDTSLSLLVSTLNLIQTSLTDSLECQPNPVSDYLFCCASLYLKRVWQERPAVAPSSGEEFPLFTQLSVLLKNFQRNLLPRHEHQLDQTSFLRLYGKFVDEYSLPQSFFVDGRDFVRWYAAPTRDGTLVTDSKETSASPIEIRDPKLDQGEVIIGDADWTKSLPSLHGSIDAQELSSRRENEKRGDYNSMADLLV